MRAAQEPVYMWADCKGTAEDKVRYLNDVIRGSLQGIKIDAKYLALYQEGNCQPCGAIRESMAKQVVKDLKTGTDKNYWVKPITPEQAKQITEDIAREGIEKLLSRE